MSVSNLPFETRVLNPLIAVNGLLNLVKAQSVQIYWHLPALSTGFKETHKCAYFAYKFLSYLTILELVQPGREEDRQFRN